MVSVIKPCIMMALALFTSVSSQQTQYIPPVGSTSVGVDPSTLPVGAYFRPTGAMVSGQVGATTPYVRSPCPALNTLANHGFLPRDGKNIPKAQYVKALMEVLNLDSGLANFHATLLKATTSLSDLGKHNFIEHDFSVVHADQFYQGDPAAVDMNLATDLLGRAVNGVLGVQQFGEAAAVRMQLCTSKPSGCKLSGFHRSLAFREAASILRVFGGAGDETCRVDFAQSFLVDERIPDSWRKPATQVRLADLSATGRNIETVMKKYIKP